MLAGLNKLEDNLYPDLLSIQEIAVSNMLELEALRQLLFEKGIITKDEFLAKFERLDREVKERRDKS